MHGVAEYMYENADIYGLDPNRMYLLGLLHDIGYIYNGELHELKGSTLLDNLGYADADIIMWHGTPPDEYEKLTGKPISKELKYLIEADIKIGPNGDEMEYDERLRDIQMRYGEDSREAKIAERIVGWLYENA